MTPTHVSIILIQGRVYVCGVLMSLGDFFFGLLSDHFVISKKKITCENAFISTKDTTDTMTFILLKKMVLY